MFELPITKEFILNKITQEQIFRKYCNNFKKIGVKFSSELRKDPNPSCIISPYNGILWYKDFGDTSKAVDCFNYVMIKYSINYTEALKLIASDIGKNLVSTEVKSHRNINTIYNKINTSYEFKLRNYTIRDKEYWGKYYLTPNILKHFNIFPVQYIKIIKSGTDGFTIRPKNGYVYIISEEYKIYKFLILDKDIPTKWFGNSGSIRDNKIFYEGYEQLPKYGDTLIITKSLKDVAVLYKLGYASFAPNGESVVLNSDIISSIKSRFRDIYLFYDNDKPGIKGSNRNAALHNIKEIRIPERYQVKDISDFIEMYGEEHALAMLQALLENKDDSVPY